MGCPVAISGAPAHICSRVVQELPAEAHQLCVIFTDIHPSADLQVTLVLGSATDA